MTKIVNLRKDGYDVYIGRQINAQLFDYGNPFPKSIYGLEGCLERYKEHFTKRVNDPGDNFKEKIEELRGKVLGCYCKPERCHGDIIVAYLDGDNE